MPKGKTLDEFKKIHDRKAALRERVTAGLKTLGSSWEYEGDFLKRTGIAARDWGLLHAAFAEHMVIVKANFGAHTNGAKRRVVAGTKKFAEQLRASLES